MYTKQVSLEESGYIDRDKIFSQNPDHIIEDKSGLELTVTSVHCNTTRTKDIRTKVEKYVVDFIVKSVFLNFIFKFRLLRIKIRQPLLRLL